MQSAFLRTLAVVTLALALAACNTGPKGVRITNNGTSATTDKTPVPITDFTAEQIRASISGKTSPECGVFKNTGDAYFAAKSRLVEMKT